MKERGVIGFNIRQFFTYSSNGIKNHTFLREILGKSTLNVTVLVHRRSQNLK